MSITADMNTYIRGGAYAGTTYADSKKLIIKNAKQDGYDRKSFIHFDLGEISTQKIQNAVLKLHLSSDKSSVVTLCETEGSWDPEFLTWNDQPQSTGQSLEFGVNETDPAQWVEIDVTPLLQNQESTGSFRLFNDNKGRIVISGIESGQGPTLTLTMEPTTNFSHFEDPAEVGFEGERLAAEPETTADVGIVLRAYNMEGYFKTPDEYEEHAQAIMTQMGIFSFGKVKTYAIWDGGEDFRWDVDERKSFHDREALQAALDGWPAPDWDWVLKPFYGGVPELNEWDRALIQEAMVWMEANKAVADDYEDNFEAIQETKLEEGHITQDEFDTRMAQEEDFFDKISGITRFRNGVSDDLQEGMSLPQGYDPANYKTTLIIFHTASQTWAISGGSRNLKWMGVTLADGSEASGQGAYVGYDGQEDFDYGKRTSIHELVHSLGMGTHDNQNGPSDLYPEYSVMRKGGSFDTLVMNNRVGFLGWLSAETAYTDDPSQVCDNHWASDPSVAYILRVGDPSQRLFMELNQGQVIFYSTDEGGSTTYEEITPEYETYRDDLLNR